MAVYMIADIKVTDNKWVPAYAASVHELVHKHGGKYLSRSGNVKTLEGKPLETNLIALIQFPSTQAVKSFLADPGYVPFAAARKNGSESRFQLIDDTDVESLFGPARAQYRQPSPDFAARQKFPHGRAVTQRRCQAL